MAKEYVINGKRVVGWFRRGKARIPRFEDGTIGHNQNKVKNIEELDSTANWLYKNDVNEWNKFTDDELKELAKLSQITKQNPGGRAYDDEVFDEMDRRGLKLDNKSEIRQKMEKSVENLKNKTMSERAKEIDKYNNNINGEDRSFAGWELYSDDPHRFDDILKKDKKNPIENMSNERIKEKENTLANDKAMLEGMKRKNINEIQGWEQKDFENRINKNEEYLKVANDKKVTLPDGTPIDQNYIKDIYSGMSYDEVKRANDFDKEWMKSVRPEAKAMQMAKVAETDKYLSTMERYESRISDEYGKKDWGDNVYPFSEGTAWKGTKSGQNLTTTEIAKAVTDKMKEAYPGIKISRKTSYYSGGSSADFSITASDKPLIRDISDFSETELNRLYNKGYNSNYYKDVGEFKEALSKRLSSGNIDVNKYNIDDDYELTPYGKQVIKDLNKVIDAYNFDESDSMTDYFHTGFYSDISIGKYNKPYQVTGSKSSASKGGNTSLGKMSTAELRSLANEYGLKSNELSRKQLLAQLIAVFNK